MSSQKVTSHKTVTNKTVTQKAARPTAKKAPAKGPSPKKGLVEQIAAEETDTLKMFIRTYALF